MSDPVHPLALSIFAGVREADPELLNENGECPSCGRPGCHYADCPQVRRYAAYAAAEARLGEVMERWATDIEWELVNCKVSEEVYGRILALLRPAPIDTKGIDSA